MLPGVMLAFLAEGSKFLFFDTAICHQDLWYPSGADSKPLPAESCQIGKSGYFVIAAGVTYFLSLIMICLKAPELRKLKDDYGEDYADTYMAGAVALNSESTGDDPESQIPNANLTLSGDDNESGNILPAATSMVMSMSNDSSLESGGVRFSKVGSKTVASYDATEAFDDVKEDSSMLPNSGSESFEATRGEDISTSPFTDPREYGRNLSTGDGPVSGPPTPNGKLDSMAFRVVNASNPKTAGLIAGSGDSDELIDKCFTDLAKSFMDVNVPAEGEETK